MNRFIRYASFCFLALIVLSSGSLLFAGCENDLMFAKSLDDPTMAFIAEPLDFSKPFFMNPVMGRYLIDRGLNFYRDPGMPYELSQVRMQQVSCSPGLVGSNYFGDGKPGYLDLASSAPHLHLNWTAAAPGTYLFEFKLTNAKDHLGNPLKDSPVFLMVFVAGSNYADVSIKTACRMPNGSAIQLNDIVATANYFSSTQYGVYGYAQSADQSAGMRITSGTLPQVGTNLTARGTLGTHGGERVLSISQIVNSAVGDARPLFMRTTYLGGDGEVLNMPSTAGGSGLRTTGLLATLVGRIRQNGSGQSFLDDGAGVSHDPQASGVRISTTDMLSPISIPPSGTMVRITGLIGSEYSGGTYYPVIKPRNSLDLTTIE